MKVYTRRGDGGETDLFGGNRVTKDAARIEAFGTVDETNASLGLAIAASKHEDVREIGQWVQSLLFALGAYLATPDARHREKAGAPMPSLEDIKTLEGHIDAFEAELEPLRRFVLPGGTTAAAAFHVARVTCRRAERCCVTLHRHEPLDAAALGALNRLSDLFFVIARLENRRAGLPDVEWEGRSG